GVALNASLYSAYLFFDFAGYSTMAIGIGMLFGFTLPINFRNPLATLNPQDFWRRWHISLSEWLRDVVFMPIYKALSKTSFFSRHRLAAQNIG
ncbi:MBOAT family O-acyltransferase, partial [Escherichia coli]